MIYIQRKTKLPLKRLFLGFLEVSILFINHKSCKRDFRIISIFYLFLANMCRKENQNIQLPTSIAVFFAV